MPGEAGGLFTEIAGFLGAGIIVFALLAILGIRFLPQILKAVVRALFRP